MAIQDWLESHIDDEIKYTGNGSEAHFNCIVCDETRHRMYVNLNTGAVYCHNCGYKGKILSLIQIVEGVSFSKAKDMYKDVVGTAYTPDTISADTISELFLPDFRKDLQKRPIPLPDEYSPLIPGHTNLISERAVRYLHSRGITDYQILKHKMGFCRTGDYANRIIIPITENDNLRFWVARAISKDVLMKEKSPSDEIYQISKSEVIFNLDRAVNKFHSIVISEGIFDALSWGDIGVSLLGKSLYQEQLNILLDYRELLYNGIYIALDWDARDSATKMAETLSEYFTVYMINIPKDLDDPNNCLMKKGRRFLVNLIDSAEEFGEFSSIFRKFL